MTRAEWTAERARRKAAARRLAIMMCRMAGTDPYEAIQLAVYRGCKPPTRPRWTFVRPEAIRRLKACNWLVDEQLTKV